MRLFEIEEKLLPNPFTQSLIKNPLYHGTNVEFNKFLRVAHGIFATPHRDYAEGYYSESGRVVIFYANVRKIKHLSFRVPEESDIIDLFYDRDYEGTAAFLKNLSSQGYDCCSYGGEGDSVILFNNIEIVDALTGKAM